MLTWISPLPHIILKTDILGKMAMNYKNIIYLADQIMGHVKAGWIHQRGTWQIRAAYPSAAGKPFNVRIYHTPDPSFFHVNWDINKKLGQLTIHLKPLTRADYWWLCRKRTRNSSGKRIRAEEARLQFKNMIMLPKDSSEDELHLQVGCYLIREGFLDHNAKGEIYELFVKYASKNFPSLWRKISEAPEGLNAFENLWKNFKIPAHDKSFYNYLKTTLAGINKTLYNKSSLEIPLLDQEFYERTKKTPYKKNKSTGSITNSKKELGSTFYAHIYAGKIKPQKIKGKYILTPEISIQLEKYLENKRTQDNIRKALIDLAEKKGINPENLLRNARRWRRQGILKEKISPLLNK